MDIANRVINSKCFFLLGCSPRCKSCYGSADQCIDCIDSRINPPNCECWPGLIDLNEDNGICEECIINKLLIN